MIELVFHDLIINLFYQNPNHFELIIKNLDLYFGTIIFFRFSFAFFNQSILKLAKKSNLILIIEYHLPNYFFNLF